jgi:hypothetical protein
MTSFAFNHHVATLRDLQLITPSQYQQALARDDLQGLTTGSAADALFWMMSRGLVNEKKLESQVSALSETDGEQARDGLAVLRQTLDMAADLVRSMNREHMEALQSLGLIDAAQCAAGCDVHPQRVEGIIDSPARALAVLVNRGIVDEAQFEAMKNEALQPSPADDAAERSAVVSQADQMGREMVGRYVKAIAGGAFRMVGLPVLGVGMLVGLMVWLLR